MNRRRDLTLEGLARFATQAQETLTRYLRSAPSAPDARSIDKQIEAARHIIDTYRRVTHVRERDTPGRFFQEYNLRSPRDTAARER